MSVLRVRPGRGGRLRAGALTLLILLSSTAVAGASTDDEGPAVADAQEADRPADFLFGRPRGSVGVRGGWVFARAGSDLFTFVTERLTIDKSDFNAPAISADVAVALSSRAEAVVGFEFSRASTVSEYRDFVDNEGLPITQETALTEMNLGGSIRLTLLPRGREVSRLAWVPRRFVPYVGGGGGALWYQFKQSGDFVDFVDLSVFSDEFESSGWTPSLHAFGGFDMRLRPRLFLTVEGRYVWADAELSRDFVDFEEIDLAGFRLAAGVNILF
jgi:hypothetical protein